MSSLSKSVRHSILPVLGSTIALGLTGCGHSGSAESSSAQRPPSASLTYHHTGNVAYVGVGRDSRTPVLREMRLDQIAARACGGARVMDVEVLTLGTSQSYFNGMTVVCDTPRG